MEKGEKAHIDEPSDITHDSGPEIVTRYLTERAKEMYLRPGYRLRIVKYVSFIPCTLTRSLPRHLHFPLPILFTC
jgi:hypothetical protein